jgi:iron complex outermembrane receptor protein
MRSIYIPVLLLFFCPILSFAQYPQPSGGGGRTSPQIGHLYGKVIDSQSGKGVEFATVSLLRIKDTTVVSGVYTKPNGDFSLDNLPFGQFILRIYFVGYKTFQQNEIVFPPNNVEKDLGNLKIEPTAEALKEVDVTGQRSTFSLALDKKVFNVEKSLASVGGTATDVLRQVPTVNVDVDGNVTLRNGTPIIFVDGKQTPLTLDQIPADDIQSIEVITNPSAKYDAAGQSGIINIILKKNRKPGINGNLMAGLGTSNQYNGGASLSIYKNPINITLNYFANSREQPMWDTTVRNNLYQNNYLYQYEHDLNHRLFQTGRFSMDWYVDNRNTLTVQGGIGGGNFSSASGLGTVYLNSAQVRDSTSTRASSNVSNFMFKTADLGFTHNFAKDKEVYTADANVRSFSGPSNGYYNTIYFDSTGQQNGLPYYQNTSGTGNNTIVTMQTDYTDPVHKGKGKFETGLKATIVNSINLATINNYDYASKIFSEDTTASYNYAYHQQDFAGYLNYSDQLGNFGYQVGLRYEYFNYKGINYQQASTFSYTQPGLYPSVYLTQKIGENSQLQLNYSRRVDRPSFWQISPRINYANPQNLSEGNPQLKPQYTNSLEFNYSLNFGPNNLLATAYFRNTNDLITSYVTPLSGDTLLNTYVNANSANTYGAEITVATQLTSWWDITTNLNLYQTDIQASNIAQNLSNSGLSWFGKLNSNTKLPAHFTLQLTGHYQGPQVIPQGKINGVGSVDLALRKDFLKNNAASITLAATDVFNTEIYSTNTEDPGLFIQQSTRKRQSQLVRLNFSYRFGKTNFALFRKKKPVQGQQEDLAPGGDQGTSPQP